MMSTQPAFTGRSRRKQTRWTVSAADVVAKALITVGGIGTIIAVSLVFVSLFFVVAPLFYKARITVEAKQPVQWGSVRPVRITIDEYQTAGWAIYPDGKLLVFRLDTGEKVDERQLFEGKTLTALSYQEGGRQLGFGFDDGTVEFGRIKFETTFLERKEVPEELKDLADGEVAMLEKGVVQLTPQGQFRLQKVTAEFKQPFQLADRPVRLLDHIPPGDEDNPLSSAEYVFAFYADDGKLQFCNAVEKENLLTGETTLQNNTNDLPSPHTDSDPFRLLVTGRGDNVYLVFKDGRLLRYDVRKRDNIAIVEETDVLPDDGAELTLCDFTLGRETVMCGDSKGRLSGWFRTRHHLERKGDAYQLTRVHPLPAASAAVTSMGISQRSRMIAVGYENGRVRVFHVTTDQMILEKKLPVDGPVEHALISPKDNGLVAVTPTTLWRAGFDPKHPEATLASLFLPVWYEGYDEPRNQWQSSYATAAPEMKLGLFPLVFGTIKATFYTMLFGAPLALLAAIYTSEFLNPRIRSKIKPFIEMMASLPSVVLGFLAALVFAPIVETVVPAVLACFFTVPMTYLIGAYFWQMLPYKTLLRMQRFRFLFQCLILPVGFIAAYFMGPAFEVCFFAGDIKAWLDGQKGSGVGAWMLLLLPLSAVATAVLSILYVNPWLRGQAHRWKRGQFAGVSLLKFAAGCCVAFLFAYGLSVVFNSISWDPRGTYVDTYEQRNALVVGFVMGFAVIPIIYTIADDALATVPQHLRSASLGAGATPWQTAVRIVIPTAMSGLFSALMIGLGRAVGETMIVLMAGGNTPVAEWNIFNGFRTLSANIAVELPEAVQNSTHYRTLFLAALTLFILTFFVNTIAEVVRLRFRRRAYQL